MQVSKTPIAIDAEKCVACGLCAADCPLGVIVHKKTTGEVGPHPRRAERCFHCGHCMAICPTGAVTLTAFEGRDATRFRRKDLPGLSDAEALMQSRRSVRAFTEQAVERDMLERLVDLTAYAPSGHNERRVKWSMVATPEAVQRVVAHAADWMQEKVDEKHPLVQQLHLRGVVRACRAGSDLICRNAPALAIAYAPREGATPGEDAVVAAAHMELAAHAAGLGACWAGYVTHAINGHAPLRQYLGVPDDAVVHAVLMLGHPERRFGAIPPRMAPDVQWIDG
ncbi:nitroreductase family protein [Desulfobaculum senezii]